MGDGAIDRRGDSHDLDNGYGQRWQQDRSRCRRDKLAGVNEFLTQGTIRRIFVRRIPILRNVGRTVQILCGARHRLFKRKPALAFRRPVDMGLCQIGLHGEREQRHEHDEPRQGEATCPPSAEFGFRDSFHCP